MGIAVRSWSNFELSAKRRSGYLSMDSVPWSTPRNSELWMHLEVEPRASERTSFGGRPFLGNPGYWSRLRLELVPKTVELLSRDSATMAAVSYSIHMQRPLCECVGAFPNFSWRRT